MIKGNCAHCYAEFEAPRATRRYCSVACRWEHGNEEKKMARKQHDPLDFSEGAPKRTINARAKGARVELEVCKLIEAVTGTPTSRILGQARDGGYDVKWGPFALEVKARENVSMPAWQAQVQAAVGDSGQIPSVVWRQKGKKFWIAVPFEEFLQLFDGMRRLAQVGVAANGGRDEVRASPDGQAESSDGQTGS